MMHARRRWCLSEVESPEELARRLTQSTWTLCTAFYVHGHERYLFLNDSTHEDGAGEFAVLLVNEGRHTQIESITFSWCSMERGLALIQEVLVGEFDNASYATPVQPRIDTAEAHGRCHFCA